MLCLLRPQRVDRCSFPRHAEIAARLDLSLNTLGRESDDEKRMSIGDEPRTARFKVQILRKQPFNLGLFVWG